MPANAPPESPGAMEGITTTNVSLLPAQMLPQLPPSDPAAPIKRRAPIACRRYVGKPAGIVEIWTMRVMLLPLRDCLDYAMH